MTAKYRSVVLLALAAFSCGIFDDFEPLGGSNGSSSGPPPVPCESDAECHNGWICTHDPVVHDLSAPLTCVGDGCTLSTECGGLCHLGLSDVGVCVDLGPYPCDSNDDCGNGRPTVCVSGSCRECATDADCGVAALCVQDPALPAGATYCARPCAVNTDCRRGCCAPNGGGALLCAPVDDCR